MRLQKLVIMVIVLYISLLVGGGYIAYSKISDAGGVKASIVLVGKGVKNIYKEIQED